MSAPHKGSVHSSQTNLDGLPLEKGLSPMFKPFALDRNYEYRRRLPSLSEAGPADIVTFCRLSASPSRRLPAILFSSIAFTITESASSSCRDRDARHAHLLLTPMQDEHGWPHALAAILKLIKGVSSRSVNKLLNAQDPCGRRKPLTTCCAQRKALRKNWNTSGKTR